MRSVADRLRVHYGEAGRLRVDRSAEGGARVEVTLPAVPASVVRKAVS
jgi:hypothetical protein